MIVSNIIRENPVGIDEDYVTIEIAHLAKESNFNEKTYTCYPLPKEGEVVKFDLKRTIRGYRNSEHTFFISAPTIAHLQKWFSVIHNIHIIIFPNGGKSRVDLKNSDGKTLTLDYIYFDSYDEATSEGFKLAFSLINTSKDE